MEMFIYSLNNLVRWAGLLFSFVGELMQILSPHLSAPQGRAGIQTHITWLQNLLIWLSTLSYGVADLVWIPVWEQETWRRVGKKNKKTKKMRCSFPFLGAREYIYRVYLFSNFLLPKTHSFSSRASKMLKSSLHCIAKLSLHPRLLHVTCSPPAPLHNLCPLPLLAWLALTVPLGLSLVISSNRELPLPNPFESPSRQSLVLLWC